MVSKARAATTVTPFSTYFIGARIVQSVPFCNGCFRAVEERRACALIGTVTRSLRGDSRKRIVREEPVLGKIKDHSTGLVQKTQVSLCSPLRPRHSPRRGL